MLPQTATADRPYRGGKGEDAGGQQRLRNAKPLASERYLNLTMDTTQPRYAVKVVNDSSKLVKLRAGSAAASGKRPAAGGTLGAAITPATLTSDATPNWTHPSNPSHATRPPMANAAPTASR